MFFSNLIRRWLHRAIKFAAVLTMCSSTTALADSEPFIIDLYMGEPVPQDVMLDDLSAVRIVYLGEIHTIARHHELQAQILRGLLDRELKLALGMEMFSRESQPILDRWQTGNQSVADLIMALGKRALDQSAGLRKSAYPGAGMSRPHSGSQCKRHSRTQGGSHGA